MSSGGLFSFRPELGETPETLERRRKVAEAMLAGAVGRPAQNVGQGLAQIGQAIGGRLALGRANRGIAAGQAGAADVFSRLFGGGGGAGETAALPGAEPVAGVPPTAGSVALEGANTGLPDVARMEAYIREKAPTYGVDPDVAVRVARSEGLAPGTWQSNVMGRGGRETSYGPFQLLAGGGLGDKFQRTTGLDLRDPNTWQQQIDFALGQAAKGGWTPWHGAAKVGVGPRTGIGGAPAVTAALAGTEPVASADPAALAAAGMGGSNFDFSRFATGGAAARPDSFTGLQPSMSSGLEAMISSAPADIQNELRVMSAFRSPETQERLWQQALKKYGSASAARKWVAPPGRSQHGAGNAIDWKFASPRAREWAHKNAARFGFSFPLSHEPWHMEVAGARGSRGGPPVRQSASGRQPLNVNLRTSMFDQAGGAGGVGVPAVAEALMAGPRQQPIASADPAALAAAGMSAPYDPLSGAKTGVPFRPAGGPTPYSAGATVLGGGSANVGAPSPPLPPMRPAVAPVVPPVAPAVAPGAPTAPGVAPVAQALGIDPLPQTSGLVGPVASAGHESLSPGAQAVAGALSGGAGTDALAGGGGGLLRRLFGPRAPAAATPAAAVAGGGGAVPPAAATGETAAVPGTEPVAGVPAAPGGAGALSPMAQRAIAVIQNPWANEGQLAIAKTMLEQELQQADPKYRADLEKTLLDLEQARTPTRAMTDAEKRDQGIDPSINARIDAKGNVTEGPKIEPKIIGNRAFHPVTGEELWRAAPGTKLLTSDEAKAMRLPLGAGNWMVDEDGKPSVIEGTEPSDPEYNDYVREELAAGRTPVDRFVWKKAGAVSVSTSATIGGEAGPNQKLRAKLSEKEGERWSSLMDAGNLAAGRRQQLEVLRELLKLAPQGPVTGWLADQFSGFSTAGDAANAIIAPMVPTLRVPGSGATSDIEYAGMVRGMPGLPKDPVANQIILETMMAKTEIDIARADVISEYMSVDPNDEKAVAAAANTARKKMQELDRKSILSPRAYALIAKAGGFADQSEDPAPETVPEGVDPANWQKIWDAMTDEQKAEFE